MSFTIMQLSLTYYSLGVTISFCKFWFENDTLITARLDTTDYTEEIKVAAEGKKFPPY